MSYITKSLKHSISHVNQSLHIWSRLEVIFGDRISTGHSRSPLPVRYVTDALWVKEQKVKISNTCYYKTFLL